MSDKKHIDRLFQEKFKDFEASPNDQVWERISDSLSEKDKKRRPIIFWWQLAGVAAAIIILIAVGTSLFTSNDNTQLPIVDTDSINKTEKNTNQNTSTENDSGTNTNDEVITDVADSDNTSKTSDSKNSKTPNSFNNTLNTDTQSLVESSSTNSQKSSNSSPKNKSVTTTNKTNSTISVASNETTVQKDDIKVKEQILHNDIIKKEKETAISANTSVADNNPTTKSINGSKPTEEVIGNKESDIKAITQKPDAKDTVAQQNNTTEKEKTTIVDSNTSVADNNTTNKKSSNDPKSTEDTIQNKEENAEALTEKPSIEEAIAEQENTDEKEKEESLNRWRVSPNVAPVYFSSLGNGSPIDNQFNENSKGSDVSFSYGLRGSYAVSKRLTVRAGINNVNLNQNTGNVFVFNTDGIAARNDNSSVSSSTTLDNVTLNNTALMSVEALRSSTTPELFNTKDVGTIEQRFGFIEVPVELEYRLLDKKFGINVIGGFSTLFLNTNDIYIDVNGDSTRIGEATNINSTSFSANFGLGVDYNMSSKWNLHLEPMFKYQLNTFTNTTNSFRPYVLGVYTGLSYKF